MLVEMGADRVHHAFWRFDDKNHPDYVPGNPFERRFATTTRGRRRDRGAARGPGRRRRRDRRLRPRRPAHGRRDRDQRVARAEGLPGAPRAPTRSPAGSRRSRSTGRRRPAVGRAATTAGCSSTSRGASRRDVDPERVRGRSATADRRAGSPGRPRGPADRHAGAQARGSVPDGARRRPPDLFVYFGDLRWRSVGTVGDGPIHTFENDTGPDDANHAPDGLFIVTGPGVARGGPVDGMQLMDVTPTVLRLFGLDVPADMHGRPL